jgi:hypothetical protein
LKLKANSANGVFERSSRAAKGGVNEGALEWEREEYGTEEEERSIVGRHATGDGIETERPEHKLS